MNRKPYPKYKESGVEWLGQVPEEWAVTKGRYIGSLLGSVTVSENDFEDDGTETRSGILYAKVDDLNRIDGSLILKNTNTQVAGYRAFSAPFLLFPKRGAAIFTNKVAIALHPMLFDPNLMGWRVNSTFNVKFVAYCLIARRLDDLADVSTVPQINNKHINPSGFPYPSLPEQIAIADFLDRETGLIDTLVAKKRRLIALLGEKRTALISRTVTRGLPADTAREFGLEPHTRFKDSGIEWLGEVPEGWEIVPLRHLILALDQGWSPTADSSPATGDQWGVLKLSAIRGGSFAPSDNKALDDLPNGINPLTPNDGDVLISRANTPERVGDACLVKGEHPWRIIPDLIYRLRLDRKKVLPVFVIAFLLSRGGRAQIQADARGSNGSMVKLGQSHLRSWLFPLPPLPEQTAIAAYLDRETAKIDQLVTKVEAAIARLLEYRTALITAAVTGKIDVRDSHHSRAYGSPEEVL